MTRWPIAQGRRPWRLRSLDRLDLWLVVVLAGLAVAVVATLPFGLHVHFLAPGVDVLFDTISTLVAGTVAVLAWLRYRQRGDPAAVLQAAAFVVAGVANVFSLLLVLGSFDEDPGIQFAVDGQGSLYVSTAARLLTGCLLVLGGAAALRRQAARRQRLSVVLPALILLAFSLLVALVGDSLPPLSGPFDPVAAASSNANLPASTPLGTVVQLIGAVLFLWAAFVSRTLYRRDGSLVDGYFAVGLVFAAFGQGYVALYPGTYPGLVTAGDMLRMAFDCVLLLGIEADVRLTMSNLRRANQALERLRHAEADRAALEERTRLSRELHDGLAQELWLAKLAAARLAALPDLDGEAVALCHELNSVIDAGLTDARQAVMALRLGSRGPEGPLSELMRRYVEDFGDRFGLRAEFDCGDEPPRLGHRAEAELLHIVHEALTNVRRHADATVVQVHLGMEDGLLRVTVRDNGRGFDVASVPEGRFGLTSMHERAELIGGRLIVESQPMDGTRITAEVPVGAAEDAPLADGIRELVGGMA